MLALLLALLPQDLPQDVAWTDANRAGYHWTPSESGHAYLELELPAAPRDAWFGGDPDAETDDQVSYRLVAQRDLRHPPVRRTPHGVRSLAPLALREVDEVLAEGVLRRPPIAVAVLRANRGFVVLEEPFLGAVHERFGPLDDEAVENPHFLQVYDAAGELRYERRPCEVLSPAAYARLSAPAGPGCGTIGPSERVGNAYRTPPGNAGLWELGSLHVAVRGTGAGWVLAAIDLDSGERVDGDVTRLPYTLSPRGPCVGGDLALALMLDADPAGTAGLGGVLENERAPLAMRVRAADHLGRRHRRAGRALLLDVAGTETFDPSLRYAVGLAAQALGRVLDRSEAGRVIELARATPYDRDPFGQALLDMEEAGAKALVLAQLDETDPHVQAFLRGWVGSALRQLGAGDAELAAALGRLATEHPEAHLAFRAWLALCRLSVPAADEEAAAVVARGGPHLRHLLEHHLPRTRRVLDAVFARLDAAIRDEDGDELEFLLPRLRSWTDASAAARLAGARGPDTTEEWLDWWTRADDRPQRCELRALAERSPREAVSGELTQALEACLASDDPAGAYLAAEALLGFEGRIHAAGLAGIWRATLAATRPDRRRGATKWLALWSAGPPRGEDAEAAAADAALLEVLDPGQFVWALWSVYRDHDLELGPAVHELLRTCPTQSEAIARILALERERD